MFLPKSRQTDRGSYELNLKNSVRISLTSLLSDRGHRILMAVAVIVAVAVVIVVVVVVDVVAAEAACSWHFQASDSSSRL